MTLPLSLLNPGNLKEFLFFDPCFTSLCWFSSKDQKFTPEDDNSLYFDLATKLKCNEMGKFCPSPHFQGGDLPV